MYKRKSMKLLKYYILCRKDYITNLQEENTDLKKQVEELKDYIGGKQKEILKLYKIIYNIQDLLEDL